MKFKKLLILILPIACVFLITTTNVNGSSGTKLAYIYYDDTTTANSYYNFLNNEGFNIDLIDVDVIASGMFDSHDIIIIGPDLGSWGTLHMDETKEAIVDNSGAAIIGLGNGGWAFFGIDGLSLYLGYDNGGSITGITNIDVIDDGHRIFNTPNDLPIGNIQLYLTGSTVFYTVSPPSHVELFGNVAGISVYYCLCSEYDRYFLWGFESSPGAMTTNGKNLFLNILDYLGPTESEGIPGYNMLLILGIFSVLSLLIFRKKLNKKI
jgi:hypothetical protein